MSYFAQVKNGIVQEVISANQAFIDTLPDASDWIQTSYNTRGGIHYAPNSWTPDGGIALRANYAGIGYIYDSINDVFYASAPFPSWVISAPTWIWQPPIPYPMDGNQYFWDEDLKQWVLAPNQ